LKVLAWPDYRSPDELDGLLSEFGAAMAARDDVCLCLRLDPSADGAVVEAMRALRDAHDRTLGEGDDLEILLVAEPMSGGEWARLAAAVQAVVVLPSSSEGHRAEFLLEAGLLLLKTTADLEQLG
jgi:thiamine monophosphate kinase